MSQGVEQKVANLLRSLADEIERNPDFLQSKQKSNKVAKPEINLFDLVAEGGEVLLRKKLESLSIIVLKQIIRVHSFDSSKLSERWKNRQRLIDLIVKQTMTLDSKGNVFL